MNVQNEWDRWAETWQQQPPVDMEQLRRRARRKLWRMRLIVALELLVTVVAVGQVARLILHPGVEWQWKFWGGMTMVFLLVVQGLLLHVRRGAWRATGEEAGDILRLTAKRAAAGIRLAKLNAWSALLWLAVTLAVAAPELVPAHWEHDPHLRTLVLLQCAVNLPIIAVGVGLCVWYIRRQRRRLREVRELLRDYDA